MLLFKITESRMDGGTCSKLPSLSLECAKLVWLMAQKETDAATLRQCQKML